MKAMMVLTTVGDEEQGNLIARELVGRRHAACVNMVSGVKSFYRWQGQICHDGEYLLIVKTMASELDGVTKTIQELHSYDLPEVLAFEIAEGERGFLEWIAGSLDKEADFGDEDGDQFPDLDEL